MNTRLTIFGIIAIALVAAAHAATYESTVPTTIDTKMNEASLTLGAIKYDPYPVNPGEWFDAWVSVQDIGEQDARDVTFSLEPAYPFTQAEGQTQYTYAAIAGRPTAYQAKLPGENATQANQALLRFHVKAADGATEGTYNLRVHARYHGDTQTYSDTFYDVPITIQKTKTNFTIAMQDSSAQRTTFAVSNVGGKPAGGVTVTLLDKDAVAPGGSSTALIGNLGTGDFTVASFALAPSQRTSLRMEVSYTDTSGTRASVDDDVPVTLFTPEPAAPVPVQGDTVLGVDAKWAYAFVALVVGIVVALVLGRVARRS